MGVVHVLLAVRKTSILLILPPDHLVSFSKIDHGTPTRQVEIGKFFREERFTFNNFPHLHIRIYRQPEFIHSQCTLFVIIILRESPFEPAYGEDS